VTRVHPTAIVGPRARLATDVEVGPYALVEGDVELAEGCALRAHAIVHGQVSLGPRCVVHSFAVVGGLPQARHHDGSPAPVVGGADNVFRGHSTVHGGTEGRATRLGADNLVMVGAHVGHDAQIGSHCVLSNSVQIAGHAVVEDYVTFGGLSGVAQCRRVGESAFVAAAAVCERDVPPFVVVQGDRARVRTVNVVGLRRRGIPEGSIAALERAVRRLWSRRTTWAEELGALASAEDDYVRRLVGWLTEREDR
jgi:UDP-N-acetylglucosamine acyltransferase